LGRGAFGAVFRARDPELGREVALKLLHKRAMERRVRERFLREAQVTASLDHPGIVRVHAAGEEDGQVWIAYELVAGGTLTSALAATDDIHERVRLLRDVAEALGAAHAQGIAHRDVKPANVLVDPDGRARVADFGLASALDLERLTRTGELVGTPAAMAPEQMKGEREAVGPPADVWAVGIMLHEALTGEHPFPSNNLSDLLVKVVAHDAPLLRSVVPELPVDLETIVLRALEKDPAHRYPDGLALADDLNRFLAGQPIVARRAGALGRRPELALFAVVVLSSLAIGATIPLALMDGSPKSARETAPPELAPQPQPTPPEATPAAVPSTGEPEASPSLASLVPPPPPGESEALQIRRESARSGDPRALLRLAQAYLEGKDGLAADPALGLRLCQESAKLGDAGAMVVLADRRRAAGDLVGCLAWLERAAPLSRRAKVALARALARGEGTRRDAERSMALYRQALDRPEAPPELAQLLLERALHGDAEEARRLLWIGVLQDNVHSGLLYLQLGPPDEPKGRERVLALLLPAAEEENLEAQQRVGELLLADPDSAAEGARWLERSVAGGRHETKLPWAEAIVAGHLPRNLELAVTHLSPEADAGKRPAMRALAHLSELLWMQRWGDRGRLYEAPYPPDQLKVLESRPGSLLRALRALAADGDPAGKLALGSALRMGFHVEQDFVRAQALYRTAAKAGLPRALYWLAVLHWEGQGVPADREEGKRWLNRAVKAGDPPALFRVAEAHRDARYGFRLDRPRSRRLHREAAEAGHPHSCWVVARTLLRGGKPKEAAPFARVAAAAGVPGAMVLLSDMLRDGRGVPRDVEAAADWLRRAAAAGHKGARKRLEGGE
jgi:serine/threonine protein kinase